MLVFVLASPAFTARLNADICPVSLRAARFSLPSDFVRRLESDAFDPGVDLEIDSAPESVLATPAAACFPCAGGVGRLGAELGATVEVFGAAGVPAESVERASASEKAGLSNR